MAGFLMDFVNGEEAEEVPAPMPMRSHFLRPADASITVRTDRGQDIIVKHFQIKPDSFLNKSLIIYGPSGTGKTTVLLDIMYHARELFPIVFAFAPTNMEKHDYDKIIPAPLVHENLSAGALRNIYYRQQAAARIYNEVNRPAVLRSLFDRVASCEALNCLKQLSASRAEALDRVHRRQVSDVIKRQDAEKIEQNFNRACIALYKSEISRNRARLRDRPDLTPDERKSLRFLWINPRALVVFDDATSELMQLMRTKEKVAAGASAEGDIMKNFFFKNRHAHMTHWYTFHDDCKLDSDIRKNAFYNIFTAPQVAHAYFERAANSFSKMERRIAAAVIDAVFDPNVISKHTKLLYDRENKQFYYILAEPRDNFTMCSRAVWQFCKEIESNDSQPDLNNPFMRTFNDRI